MYKILFGIPSEPILIGDVSVNKDNHIVNYETSDNNAIWCDFSLEYDSDRGYYFEFETMLGFPEKDGCKNWVQYCFDKLTEYMNENNYSTDKVMNMHEVFTDGINMRSNFETVEDAYACFKLVVNGFEGKAIF